MAHVTLDPTSSVVIVIDLQPRFLASIHAADRVVARSSFLASVAAQLNVPVLATVQNRDRMGELLPVFEPILSSSAVDKMTFSAARSAAFMELLEDTGRRQVVIVGIETHICVCLTALDLVQKGYEVVVCPDATSSSTNDRHKLGMERIRDAGVVPAHSEAIAYEWMGAATHPKFKDILQLVKVANS